MYICGKDKYLFFWDTWSTNDASSRLRSPLSTNDLTTKFKKSTVANAIAIPLPLCFSCFVPLRRFRENFIKPFNLYLSRTCDSPGVTSSVIVMKIVTIKGLQLLHWCKNFESISRAAYELSGFEMLKIGHTPEHKNKSGGQPKIIFLDVLDYSEYSDTNISNFFVLVFTKA